MRRFAQRLARLERRPKPFSGRRESEWRGVPTRDLIRFMTRDERSAYRDLLIIVRDHFHDFPEAEQETVREIMSDIMDASAARVEANEAPPVARRPSIREVYQASLRSGTPD